MGEHEDLLTQSQVEQLGRRLVGSDPPDPDDLQLLRWLLTRHDRVLSAAVTRVRPVVGSAPTARIKNTGTILEKLERYGGSWLKSLHDIAGMRVVKDFSRAEQDRLAAAIADEFRHETRAPKVVDRRAHPVQGYRAVHVIVFPERTPVEIQIRTQLQHEWAEIFEKLADVLGRGIRYGEAPTLLPGGADPSQLVELMKTFADAIDHFERLDPAKSKIYREARDGMGTTLKAIRLFVDAL